MAKTLGTDMYDYIELKIFDVHGYKRGRIITRSQLPGVLKNGMGIRHGMSYNGIKGEPNPHPSFSKDSNNANVRMTPIISTLKPCQKSIYGKRKMGSVLCKMRFPGYFSLNTSTPREATQLVLQRLQSEFGLHMKSSFEIKFAIKDSKTQKYLGEGSQWGSLATVAKHQDVLMGLLDDMHDVGVKVDTLLRERGPGQFEFTFDLAEGIEAADMLAEFRTAAYLYLKSKGCDAEFMTCTDMTECNLNLFHYNSSVWNSEGQNMFLNPENPDELSQFGKHWLAGLVEHAPAMAAMCSPTTNCYRRVSTMYGPNYANWAPGARLTTFRLKIDHGKNVYIENRVPTSACSPHLALACTVAAGMDGVRRKLELPEPREQKRTMPTSLKEALDALEADTLLKEALGPKMVELFIFTKRKQRGYKLRKERSAVDFCVHGTSAATPSGTGVKIVNNGGCYEW